MKLVSYQSPDSTSIKGLISGITLLTAILAIPWSFAGTSEPDYSIMDPALRKAIDEGAEDLDVIVQFMDSIQERDYRTLNGLGIEVEVAAQVLPAMLIHGDREQIIRLSEYERVDHMELDRTIEFLMHDTTNYINATNAWSSIIEDEYGRIVEEQPDSNRYIDGSGVTVVILDTGIDAGHPDFDYGSKVIRNLKATESGGGVVWIEEENTDTSSGHGTHCAGTAGGNGDASSMARSGVAPNCNLIGLGTGEGLSIIYAEAGLEWVYENSRPDNNPDNIRVVSNSWGVGGNENVYNPNSVISRISDRLTYENHVSVIFAAGNSGGNGNSVQTNPYSNTPSVISVAAMERNGDGVADFSSRGNKEKQHSWPDIGAPGHIIWSCAPRETIIDIAQRPTDHELYYMEISGTSMATPHVAGATALLWQAAPHMGVSDVHEDYTGPENETWMNDPNTLLSDVELVFMLSSRYDPGITGAGEPTVGIHGRSHDFAQGYGYIDMRYAVGLALTLERLRTMDLDDDWYPDTPNATVFDAYEVYRDTVVEKYYTSPTDTLIADWAGDWAHFQTQTGDPSLGTYSTNNTKFVYVPKETKEIQLTLSFAEFQIQPIQTVDLHLTLSTDGGNNFNNLPPESFDSGVKHYRLVKGSDFSDADTDKLWAFRTEGLGIGGKPTSEFFEPIAAFTVAMKEYLELSNGTAIVEFMKSRSYVAQLEFGSPSPDYSNGTISMLRYVYKYPELKEEKLESDDDDDFPITALTGSIGLILVLLAIITILLVSRRRKVSEDEDSTEGIIDIHSVSEEPEENVTWDLGEKEGIEGEKPKG